VTILQIYAWARRAVAVMTHEAVLVRVLIGCMFISVVTELKYVISMR
jgi:hypothetical protein